jgi:hypothetical protein
MSQASDEEVSLPLTTTTPSLGKAGLANRFAPNLLKSLSGPKRMKGAMSGKVVRFAQDCRSRSTTEDKGQLTIGPTFSVGGSDAGWSHWSWHYGRADGAQST